MAEPLGAPAGDLDRRSARLLRDALDDLMRSPAPAYRVDVSGLTLCDAEGLRTLVMAQRRARRAGRAFCVTGPEGGFAACCCSSISRWTSSQGRPAH